MLSDRTSVKERARPAPLLLSIGALAAALALALAPAIGAEPTDTVLIAGPSSGPYAPLTEAIKAGVAQARQSKRHGGRAVTIIERDDACEAGRAREVAEEAVRIGVRAVIGHPCAGAAMAAAGIYANAGIVFLAPATRHPRLTQGKHASLFRLAGRADAEGHVAGQFLGAAFAGKAIAIVSDRTQASRALADSARAALRTHTGTVIVGHLAPGERDYGTLARRLSEARVAAVYFTGGALEATLLQRQIREAGHEPRIVVTEAAQGESLWRLADGGGEGLLVTAEPGADAFPGATAITAELRARGTFDIMVALRSHAAVEVWRQLADGVPAERRKSSFATVLGPVRFDDKGDADLAAFAIHERRDGRLEPFWMPPSGQ